MKLRIVRWNLHMSSNPERTRDFIAERIRQGPTVVCLEEVRRVRYKMLVESLKPQSSCFSLDLHEPEESKSTARKLGVAVLGFGLPVATQEVLDHAVFPERTLSVCLGGAFGPIHVIAFHSLTLVAYHEIKDANFLLIADYLLLHRSELDFLCFDANGPRHDSMDISKLEFSGLKSLDRIMGPEKVHDLVDSYVDHLRNRSEVVTRDPLTVSYTKGRLGQRQTEVRYDYIMHSPKWRVTNCEYPYQASIAARSDHSAVIADYELK